MKIKWNDEEKWELRRGDDIGGNERGGCCLKFIDMWGKV
jgi:hypothetical protein